MTFNTTMSSVAMGSSHPFFLIERSIKVGVTSSAVCYQGYGEGGIRVLVARVEPAWFSISLCTFVWACWGQDRCMLISH